LHLHIALIGGQLLPVYYGIKYKNPDEILFVCSEQTQDVHKLKITIPTKLKILSPVDIIEVENFLKSLDNLTKNYSKISINITGGTKIWSILFFDYFKNNEQAEIFYIDQNNKIWDLKSKTYSELLIEDVVSYLSIIHPIANSNKLSDFNEEDQKAALLIEKIRCYAINEFNSLVEYLAKHNNLTDYQTEKGSIIRYDSQSKSFFIELQKNKEKKNWHIKSPHARYLLFNTGWFELKVARILSQWKYAQEILMNCIFKADDGKDKNEVDIIVNTGKKLLFVECKTQVHRSTDIDKFATVIRNYGGMATKGLLVTDAKLKHNIKEKCKDSNLLTFSLKEVSDHFNLEQMLFLMLENEWLNINPK
jgi:hypothetical protein